MARVIGARRLGRDSINDKTIRTTVHEAAALFGNEQLAICANQIAIGHMPREAPFQGFSELYSGSTADQKGDTDISQGIVFDQAAATYVYRGLDVYAGDNVAIHASAAYQRAAVDELRALIAEIKRDRFSATLYGRYVAAAEGRFPGIDVMAILWQNGLLGVVDGPVLEGPVQFYGASEFDTLSVPANAEGYALHPCLIDAAGVHGVGAPVYPGRMESAAR